MDMSIKTRVVALLALVAMSAAGCSAVASLGGNKLGDTGDPVHLTVGYQPYYTESWSGLIMRDKKFWRTHLPEGSTVDFQVGLQGS